MYKVATCIKRSFYINFPSSLWQPWGMPAPAGCKPEALTRSRDLCRPETRSLMCSFLVDQSEPHKKKHLAGYWGISKTMVAQSKKHIDFLLDQFSILRILFGIGISRPSYPPCKRKQLARRCSICTLLKSHIRLGISKSPKI